MKLDIKKIFYKFRSWLLAELKEDIGKLHDRLDKLELNQLKLIITTNETPLKEKLLAGDIYIKKGGNGEIKTYYKVLKEEYEEELRKRS